MNCGQSYFAVDKGLYVHFYLMMSILCLEFFLFMKMLCTVDKQLEAYFGLKIHTIIKGKVFSHIHAGLGNRLKKCDFTQAL